MVRTSPRGTTLARSRPIRMYFLPGVRAFSLSASNTGHVKIDTHVHGSMVCPHSVPVGVSFF